MQENILSTTKMKLVLIKISNVTKSTGSKIQNWEAGSEKKETVKN